MNVPIPLFTLVLIKYKGEAIDIGTLNFMFTSYSDIGLEEGFASSDIDYFFKFNLPYTNLNVNVDQKDILNIRSEFSTIPLNKTRFSRSNLNYRINDINTEFFTYLATILIELDPL